MRWPSGVTLRRSAAGGRARLAGRLPLPQPVALGLARPFARPARALAMGTAILFGTVAVTFTVGMGASLGQVMKAKAHDAADVVVPAPMPDSGPGGPGPGERPSTDPAAVAAAVEVTAGTGKYYRAARVNGRPCRVRATVSGLNGTTDVIAFTGDASWGGCTMVAGRWIDRPGEAVVPPTPRPSRPRIPT